ncbi:MAG TPA: glycosyltransferase family 4 protein [Candidatus Udaeobacter sp.]|jgi:glycosyltransferase involved in cell wall biosynthesis
MRLGYLYSRYPVISQTFCDAEMLALERRGTELVIGSVYPPLTSLRHEHIARLEAAIHYAPPQKVLTIWEKNAKRGRIRSPRNKWPEKLVQQHEQKYGPAVKADLRARNALYFADFFARSGVDHVHVHFANRAAHTALFLREISGIPFSVTAHGQDFMKDLGSDDLLREICAAAEFVAAETDYSRDLLRQRCPDSAPKIHRVYNGIDLERFPSGASTERGGYSSPKTTPRILSVGRLVTFKGFEDLIDACSELAQRGVDFACDIIGDGPLRDALQAKIEKFDLSSRVNLLGSLSQNAVLEKLQATDIFALASTTDAQGATDVFPTVILEAMASARPVISTRLAGIPELVVAGETGILISPSDTSALTNALEQLLRDPDLRLRYGSAARLRIEQHFRIETTVVPLIEMFEGGCSRRPAGDASVSGSSLLAGTKSSHCPDRASRSEAATNIAYLIDRWPDRELPLLERELKEMKRRNVPIVPFVCELNPSVRLNRDMQEIATSLEFLPDAMVLEAEWRANRALGQKLEEGRAQQSSRAPDTIFLRQARFALVLRKLLQEQNVSHVHATSSRALVCALMLKKLSDVTVSATIEARSELSRNWVQNALAECVGGRVSSRKLVEQFGSSFMVDKTTFRSAPRKALGLVTKKTRIDLTTGARFWQQWAELLLRWSCSDRKSKIENRK